MTVKHHMKHVYEASFTLDKIHVPQTGLRLESLELHQDYFEILVKQLTYYLIKCGGLKITYRVNMEHVTIF